MRRKHAVFRQRSVALAAGSLLAAGLAWGGLVDLADVPVFLAQGAPPNFFLTVSDTMARGQHFAPPGIENAGESLSINTLRIRSSSFNRLYYDPGVTYRPPIYLDTELPDATFERACLSPFYYYRRQPGNDWGSICPSKCVLDLSRHYRSPFATTGSIAEGSPMEPGDYYGDGVPEGPFCNWWPYPVRPDDPPNSWSGPIQTGLDPTKDQAACSRGLDNAFPSVRYDPDADPEYPPEDRVACETSAFYYVFEPPGEGFDPAIGAYDPLNPINSACSDSAENDACYRRVDVGSPDDVAQTRSLHPELEAVDAAWTRRNFANWFSYYRNPMLAIQSAVSRFATGLTADFRIGYQDIYSPFLPLGTSTGDYQIAAFTPARRQAFFDWLFDLYPNAGVLAASESTIHIGDYLRTEAPYRVVPADPDSRVDECRRNYHLLFADDGWVDWSTIFPPSPAADAPNGSNWDNTAYTTADGHDYVPAPPYADGNVGGFADVAFYYWSRDLLGGAEGANSVLPLIRDNSGPDRWANPKNDPATWQHLVNYVIGFGVEGNLPYSGDTFPDIIYEAGIWGVPGSIDVPNGIIPYYLDPVGVKTLVDDFWHGAVNSRGGFYRADNVPALLAAADEVLKAVNAKTVSGAASSSPTVGGGKLYQTNFDSADWSGEVTAWGISSGRDQDPCGDKEGGEICANPAWQAAAQLDARDPDVRIIATFDAASGDGVQFKWTSLSDAQQQALAAWDDLNAAQQQALLGGTAPADATPEQIAAAADDLGEARLDWLRGVRTGEQQNGGDFRNRSTVLGDIVDSPPLYVGPPGRQYDEEGYRSFVLAHAARPGRLYVGANDGMLHAFEAATGAEVFAYIPGLVFDRLADLTAPEYPANHRPYVDGPLGEGDVLIEDGGEGAWKTVLVGALGKGGQGLFALDITNPAPLDQDAAANFALWEFDDYDAPGGGVDGDPDLGYVYGRPAIVQIRNGADCTDDDPDTACPTKWVAIAGNGYNNTCEKAGDLGCTDAEEPVAACTDGDPATPCPCTDEDEATPCTVSTTGNAVLYAIDIAEGTLAEKWDTGVGLEDDPNQRPNGLGQPTVVDADGDLIADFAYAGDLLGNVWKFNLVDLAEPPKRLFTAKDGAGNVQAITTPVAVARHPTGVGTLVLFGTGRLLGQDDVADRQVQSFYAIWDDGAVAEPDYDPPARARLLQQWFFGGVQQVEDEEGNPFSEARVSTDTTIDWGEWAGWYIDLCMAEDADDATCAAKEGERVIVAPVVQANRVVFVSMIPSGDPCIAGGASWVNALDLGDGSRLLVTPFDFDGDGIFGSEDLVTVTVGGTEIQVPGSSIRLVDKEGVYSAAASLVREGGVTMGYLSTSAGELVTLRESSALGWRVWQEVR